MTRTATEPEHVIAAIVATLDPAVNQDDIVALIRTMVPYQRNRSKVANQLVGRPDLLTGAGAHGSATVVTLIGELRSRGVAGIVAPACPYCQRILRLPPGREGLRCCVSCWNKAHAKPCARCSKVSTMARCTNSGESLCGGCARVEQSLHEECGGCGRLTLPARRDGDSVLCQNCTKPPIAICSSCKQAKPCSQAKTALPRCKNCADKLRAEPCSECGRKRVINRRTADGKPLCKECGSTGTCTGCQRVQPLRVRTETGGLCQTCYKHDVSARSACARCGAIGSQHRVGICVACAWPDAIRKLLTGPGGTVRAEVEPVVIALAAADPATGLNWVARARTQRMLAALAVASGPVTHPQLDRLAPATAVTHLRTILVDAGVLSTRDERLTSLERSAERRVARVKDPISRKILRSFATWHHLRRLRATAARQRLTQDQVTYAVNSLTAASRLLNWLRDRGQSLNTCNQADIDDWLSNDPFSRSRGFVTRAVERGHASDIKIPRFKNEPIREVFADHGERWNLVRRLLSDDTITISDRVAGLLVLLYAQRAARITQLTTKHVIITQDSVELSFANTPISLPPMVGDLVLQLLAEQRRATASDHEAWLYPAARLGQPLAPRELLGRLRALGISPTLGRNTALMEMTAEMPAAVIARLLGISLDRATRWTYDAGNTRPGYAREVARRDQLR